ncbi:BPSL0761 family protein [Metapseudomonas resinovorans]|uniref:Uncharacterized protein n=1 Tax=Metapseudomonas resinovorans NBRC 106553 TaxID=1245471 RepID=S6AFA9_METRE|nr:BPSL0761 family protein [Pseudomonas resinovorans]BAN48597.1 hypothetical protein PCA10_28650 [Pseudomonas resinovorans NBRC 106553]
MTVPYERTRAVIQTGEFLKRLEQDVSLSEDIRGMANQLLRHYPSKAEVLLQGLLEESRPADVRISPFFSSSPTYHPMEPPIVSRVWRSLRRKVALSLFS